MRDGVRIAQKSLSEATAQKSPTVLPEDGGDFCACEGEGDFCTPRAEISSPGAAMDPEDAEDFCADPPSPHARQDGGPVEEGATWGGPEGLETFVV